LIMRLDVHDRRDHDDSLMIDAGRRERSAAPTEAESTVDIRRKAHGGALSRPD